MVDLVSTLDEEGYPTDETCALVSGYSGSVLEFFAELHKVWHLAAWGWHEENGFQFGWRRKENRIRRFHISTARLEWQRVLGRGNARELHPLAFVLGAGARGWPFHIRGSTGRRGAQQGRAGCACPTSDGGHRRGINVQNSCCNSCIMCYCCIRCTGDYRMAETKRQRTATRKYILSMADSNWELRNYFRRCLTYRWAADKGITGNKGGWLKSRTGNTMAQGYGELYQKYREQIAIHFWGMDCNPHPALDHVAAKREEELTHA